MLGKNALLLKKLFVGRNTRLTDKQNSAIIADYCF